MSNANVNPAPPAPVPDAAKTADWAIHHGPPSSNGSRLHQRVADTTHRHRRASRNADVVAYVAGTLGATKLIAVRGEVDLATAGTLLRRLKVLAGPAPQRITLDLSQVVFIDCAGLHALDDMARLARDSGGGMGISAVSRAASRLFELADWPEK